MQKLNINTRTTGDCGNKTTASEPRKATRFGARGRRPLLWCVLLGLLVMSSATARAQSVVDAFDPGDGPTESVLAVAAQQDGRVLIGGRFTGVAGQPVAGVARLNADGTLDPTFQPQTNGTVHALALQADGKVLVGGSFSQVGGQTHGGIARVNADGTLDHAFNPGVEGTVFSINTLSSGKVLVGGFFSKVGGQTRYCLARLNADGTLDATFDTGGWTDSFIFAVAVRADGRLLVGGQFTVLGGQARAHIAQLNADGSPDVTFQPQVNANVNALALQADGKVLIGGDFTQINGQTRDRLVRLNADGTIDNSFQSGANDSVRAVATQADGRALVGGDFTQINGQARNRLARLAADGSLDIAFKPEPNGLIYSIESQADGRAFVGGDFTEIGGQVRRRVARLVAADVFSSSNIVDPSFNTQSGGRRVVAVQADGRLLVSGAFRNNQDLTTGIARFNSDGTRDHSFNSLVDVSHFVNAIAVQSDGKVLIGGEFTRVDHETRYYLARLNSDGSLDHTFTSFLQSRFTSVRIITAQPDGKILVIGSFMQSARQPRNFFVRLNSDGTLDENFNPDPNGEPRTLALQADGKILIGGGFSQVCGQVRKGIARLNADGTLDNSFNPNPNVWGGQVYTMAVQKNGRVLIGGSFSSVGGLQRMYIARLYSNGTVDEFNSPGNTYPVTSITLQANGKILVSDQLGRYRRINVDGTFDYTYSKSYSGIYSVTLQADGRALIISTNGLHRLLNNEAAQQQLSVKQATDGSVTIAWSRGGAAVEVDQVTYEVSTDGQTYNRLGVATRTSGVWILKSTALPRGRNIFIRARGTHHAAGYYHTSSSGMTVSGTTTVESVLHLFLQAGPTDEAPTSLY